MKFELFFSPGPPLYDSARRCVGSGGQELPPFLDSMDPDVHRVLRRLEEVGYTWREQPCEFAPPAYRFQCTFCEPTYESADWQECEYLEPVFDRLADLSVELKDPPPESGGARIESHSFVPEWQRFWLAGAARSYAFVRDEIKGAIESQNFVGMKFRRAEQVPPWVHEVALKDGVYMLPGASPPPPVKDENLWQLTPRITLPERAPLPESVVVHRPFSGRLDLPAYLRDLEAREDRLAYRRSELKTVGAFDIAYVREIPPPPGPGLFNEQRRVVVSRRLAEFLLTQLRPMWSRRAEFDRTRRSNVPFAEEGHDYWRPVTILEDDRRQ